MSADLAALLTVLLMACCVGYAARFDFLRQGPRSWWMSLASGVTVGYVFLGLLPKLIEGESKVRAATGGFLPFLEDHVLFISLLGLLFFYGLALARHAASERERAAPGDQEHRRRDVLFWFAVAAHAGYMFLIGYVVQDAGEQSLVRMAVLGGILGVHFLTTDFGLGHRETGWAPRLGRLALGLGLVAGWAVGSQLEVSRSGIAVSSAFIAGAILLTVLNDELPSEREARFLPFAGGCLASGLLLATIG